MTAQRARRTTLSNDYIREIGSLFDDCLRSISATMLWHVGVLLLFAASITLTGCSSLLGQLEPTPAPFTTFGTVLRDVASAHVINLSAYTLQPNAPIVDALILAARHGVPVKVLLTGQGFRYARRQNIQTAKRLRSNQIDVRITPYPLHLKALITNSATIVSDTNFSDRGLYLSLPRADAGAILRAWQGTPNYLGDFTTGKRFSLQMEGAILLANTGPITLETESIGTDNAVFTALTIARKQGRQVQVTINERDYSSSRAEHRAVAILRAEGVQVNTSQSDEKIAISGNNPCYYGSSNASGGLGQQIDFGIRIDNPRLCSFLRHRIPMRSESNNHTLSAGAELVRQASLLEEHP